MSSSENNPDRNFLRYWQQLAISLLAMFACGACMTSRIEATKDSATGINSDESIVILASSYHTTNPAEDAFMECVSDRVESGRKGIKVHPANEFRDALFPWLEPRTAPKGINDLPELLARPGISERIKSRGIRYIIWIEGDTERTSSGGSLACAIGPGGGGCFGLGWWENMSSYEAAIWDLDDGINAGSVSADVNGTSVIPAIVIPIPMIARTRAAACKGLAKQLQTFVTG
jgi:hypothetical protein